jgi:hypothetical protein
LFSQHEYIDYTFGYLLERKIGGVDADVGASVGAGSLRHQGTDSLFQALTAFRKLRTAGRGVAHPGGDGLGARGKAHDDSGLLQQGTVLLIYQGAASGRDYRGPWIAALRAVMARGGEGGDRFALQGAKVRFAMLRKDLRNRLSGTRRYYQVGVSELPSKSPCHEMASRAFAGRHEPGNDQLGSHARFAIRVKPFDSLTLA